MSAPEGLAVTLFASLAEAEPIWRELEATGSCLVFQSFDWLEPWQRLIGAPTGVTPCITLVSDAAGRPLMLLPLGIERGRLGRALVWLGGAMVDYGAPVLAPNAAARLDITRLWPALQRALPTFDYARLEKQPQLIGAEPNPFAVLPGRPYPFQAHRTRLAGDWPSYYAAKRSSTTRAADRRKGRRLAELGPVEFVIATTPATQAPLLEAFFAHKARRLVAQGATDFLAAAHHRAFLCDIVARHAPQGLVHLAAITIGGEVAAIHLGAVHKGRFYFVLPAFAEGPAARLSPGNLLIMRLMEWAFAQGLELFDFTIGDEPYKAAWCEQHETLSLSLLPATWRGRLAVAGSEAALAARARLQGQAWLRQLVQRWRRRARPASD